MKNRRALVFYINQKRFEISDERCFLSLSDFLRYHADLPGTKVVCAEGDCGACTVLLASPHELGGGKWVFKPVNSCILPLFSVDACQIVTVEGLKVGDQLHPVQQSLAENFGSQCGFCSPGIVCSMTALAEESVLAKKPITEKKAKNFLTGNLCRCTGYEPIIKAALNLDCDKIETLQERFNDRKKIAELKRLAKTPLEMSGPNWELALPVDLKQAVAKKAKQPETTVVAGATDVGVAVNKGRSKYQRVLSLQNVAELWKIKVLKNSILIPARVTLANLQKTLEKKHSEAARVLNIFASPQIKNLGTIVGNVINASPISDTIPFLLVSEAEVLLQGKNGKRQVPLTEFYLGYKKMDLKRHEIVTGILLPLSRGWSLERFYKVSQRKDLDISAVTMASRLRLKGKKITELKLAFGGVGPTVLRLKNIEENFVGRTFERGLQAELVAAVLKSISPISDVRGSKEYRQQLCKNLVRKWLDDAEQGGLL